jgi:hypothetical protein
MSLLDLKSDLSKYRAETSIEEKEGPQTSVAKGSKVFATNQPITDRLLKSIPEIKKPKKTTPIQERLDETRLDDIIRKDFDDMMVNSISEYSPTNIDTNTYTLGKSSIENVISKFGEIKQEQIVSNLNQSNTLVLKSDSGTNNNISNINPSIFDQTVSRVEQTPNIQVKPNDANDNIIIPEIIIDGKPLSMNRQNQTVVIKKDLFSPLNNVINPNIALDRVSPPSITENETPNIIKDTIKQGLVVDPKTKVFRIQSGTNHLVDESELNPKGKGVTFIATSMLAQMQPRQEADLIRYSGVSNQLIDNSRYNPDEIIRTNPSGRNDNPNESLYSFNNPQGVNYLDNRYFRGFSINQKSTDLVNKYSSIFGFPGTRGTAPAVNFMIDDNANGFKTFAEPRLSEYKNESSDYTFIKARSVNYFDINNQHTNAGFTLFARALTTNYLDNVSRFTWRGKRVSAPSVNYFDVNKEKSLAGFHTFAQTFDTKFVKQASIYDWNGKRTQSPEVNYFDVNSSYTKAGFHRLADLYETKYIRGASRFDWDGKRNNAPSVNYFDVDLKNAKTGFHAFAQKYDSKFVSESSEFDWDGVAINAPSINYFDLQKEFTTIGFHTFAQLYDTKYIPEKSRFDWNGIRRKAPSVNYFDLSKEYTTIGFHTFARKYDTKYIPESSDFDWNGARNNAPVVNYFDLYATNTTTGFHSFAQLYDTKFIEESSRFDWDGNRIDAPTVNYFDTFESNRTISEFPSGFVPKTTAGFHKFAQIFDTKYVRGSSIYDWDGDKQSAPSVNYFDFSGTSRTATEQNSLLAQFNVPRRFVSNTTAGFHTFAQKYDTKYLTDSSEYNWDGTRDQAPVVNYFDVAQTNRTISEFPSGFTSFTTAGFHKFAQIYDTKYIKDSSRYDWDGKPDRKNFRNPIPVDYFDNPTANARRFGTQFIINTPNDYRAGIMTVGTKDKFIAKTFGGFHIFAQLYDSKYIPESSRFDWDGTKDKAPSVNYFDTLQSNRTTSEANSLLADFNRPKQFIANTTAGFHIFAQKYDTKYVTYSSLYDWDGVPDKTNFRNPVPVDYFDNLLGNRTTSEENSLLAEFNKPKNFIAKTTAGFHIFAQKYDTKYIRDASIYDWDGRADRTNFRNPIAVDFFDNLGSVNDYRRRTNVGGANFLDNAGSVEGYNTRSNIGGFAFLKQIGTKDGYVRKTLSGFDIFPEHYVSRYINGASRFDWDGTRQNAPAVDFMDNVASGDVFVKNTLGGGDYLRGIIALGNLPVRDYPGGGKSRLDYHLQGYTHQGFHTFAQLYDTQYTFKIDRFGWVGQPDRLGFKNPIPVNFFDNHGITINTGTDSVTYEGEGRDGSVPGEATVINGQRRQDGPFNPGAMTFQLGKVGTKDQFIAKTTAGFHIFAQTYDSKYVPDSSRFDFDGVGNNAPAVNYFDLRGNFTTAGFHTFPQLKQTKYIPDSSDFDWNGIRLYAPSSFSFFQLEPKTDFARKKILFSIQNDPVVRVGRDQVVAPALFKISGLEPGFRTFFTNRNQTAYSPYLSEFSVLSTESPYTNFFPAPNGFTYPDANDLNARDPLKVGESSGLVRGINGFVPFLGTLNRPTYDPDDRSLQLARFLIRAVRRYIPHADVGDGTLGSKYSLTDAKTKYTQFFSFFSKARVIEAQGKFRKYNGFLPAMRLFYGTKYPIITPSLDNIDISIQNKSNAYLDPNNYNPESLAPLQIWGVNHGYGSYNQITETPEQEFLDNYLPDSLGKRPWSSQIGNLLFATMMNQYPSYAGDKTNKFYGYRRPTNYIDYSPNDSQGSQRFLGGPYEKQLRNGWWVQPTTNDDEAIKNITSNQNPDSFRKQLGEAKIDDDSANLVRKYGFLARWAIKSGELEKQYNKYDLRKDSYNPDLIWSQPYYTSNIGANWGWGVLACGRNSPTTLVDRSLADLQRIGKWMTSGKGILWMVKQFGMQFMNPFMDSWSEPFDVMQLRSSTDVGANRQTFTTNNSLLPSFGDGSSNPDSVRDIVNYDPDIFMPAPTMLYNPLSTIISAVGKGIGLHWQRHWSSAGFGFNGVHQQVPNYRELIFTTQYQTTAGVGPSLGTTNANNPLAYSPTISNGTGDPNVRQNVPRDLNQHYEAQTTYRNKTGFIDQNIAGINYLKRTFHRKSNGDWMIPAEEQSNWYSLREDHMRSGAGSPLANGTAEALDYFEEPTKRNPITRQRRYNRLIGLMKELLPQSFSPILRRVVPPDTSGFDNSMEVDVPGGGFDFSDISTQYSGPAQSANASSTYQTANNPVTIPFPNDPVSELRVKTSLALVGIHQRRLSDGEIIRISSNFGGPSSFLGIGGTKINKSSHKLLGPYSTIPLLTDDGIFEGKQRETFFALDFYASYKDRLLKMNTHLGNSYTTKNELGGDLFAITTGLKTQDKKRFGSIYEVHESVGMMGRTQQNSGIFGENVTIQPITTRKIDAIAGKAFMFTYDAPQNRLRNATVDELKNSRRAGPRMDGPDVRIDNLISTPNKQFRTTNYFHKNRFDSTSTSRPASLSHVSWLNPSWTANRTQRFNDFRWDIEDIDATNLSPDTPRNASSWNNTISMKFSTHPAISDYKTNNLEDKFGLGKHGQPGSDRGNPRVTNVLYDKVQTVISTLPAATVTALGSGPAGRGGAAQFRTYPVPILKASPTTGAGTYSFRGDRINIIDYKRANFPINHNLVYEKGAYNNPNLPGTDDLIEFYFSSIVLDGHNYCPAEVIVFRAIFDSITDNHKPSWSPVKYMGRGDPLYTYDGYERDVSFNFTVHIGSRDEMKSSWRKLNYLAGYTAPEYTKSGYIRAPLCRLNIGNLFRKMPGYISSLSYTFDNTNGTWETAQLYGDRYNANTPQSIIDESKPGVLQLPKTIQVACSFVPIGVYRPEKYGVFYPLYDDREPDGTIENGLIPLNMEKVNWMNPFDELPMPNVTTTVTTGSAVYGPPQPGVNTTPAPVVTFGLASGDADAAEYLAVPPGEESFVNPSQNPPVAIP